MKLSRAGSIPSTEFHDPEYRSSPGNRSSTVEVRSPDFAVERQAIFVARETMAEFDISIAAGRQDTSNPLYSWNTDFRIAPQPLQKVLASRCDVLTMHIAMHQIPVRVRRNPGTGDGRRSSR